MREKLIVRLRHDKEFRDIELPLALAHSLLDFQAARLETCLIFKILSGVFHPCQVCAFSTPCRFHEILGTSI